MDTLWDIRQAIERAIPAWVVVIIVLVVVVLFAWDVIDNVIRRDRR